MHWLCTILQAGCSGQDHTCIGCGRQAAAGRTMAVYTMAGWLQDHACVHHALAVYRALGFHHQ